MITGLRGIDRRYLLALFLVLAVLLLAVLWFEGSLILNTLQHSIPGGLAIVSYHP